MNIISNFNIGQKVWIIKDGTILEQTVEELRITAFLGVQYLTKPAPGGFWITMEESVFSDYGSAQMMLTANGMPKPQLAKVEVIKEVPPLP